MNLSLCHFGKIYRPPEWLLEKSLFYVLHFQILTWFKFGSDKNLHIDPKNKWVKSQVFTSSSCLICGRKSRLKDCRASLSLSSNVLLFKQVPFFDALFIPFLANDKISKTCLSLCTSLTTASNCWLIRRCWSSSKMQVFSISSWCLSSWKVEFMQPRSLKRETSSLKFVTES